MSQSNQYIHEAYWLSPSKEVFPVSKHIAFISDNLDMFSMSRPQYQAYYDKHNEPYGFEGKARKEIMQLAIKDGWIRLRNYINKGWVCELWTINDESKENVMNWTRKLFSKESKDMKFIEIEIHELSKFLDGRPETEWKTIIKNI